MSVSIVMTAFNRPRQLLRTLDSIRAQGFPPREVIVVDDGDDWPETLEVCLSAKVQYARMNRSKSPSYRNQARPLNVGIRRAKGEILILQNAECLHVDPRAIERLTSLVTESNAVFAKVIALDPDGRESMCYCGTDNPRPYFFCGAIRRDWFERLGGFDEDFTAYGFEDDDMADRLRREGVEFVFSDILVYHQWHESAGNIDYGDGAALFEKKKLEPTVRNVGREWGKP